MWAWAWANSDEAFSRPSVRMATMILAGRRASGRAAKDSVIFLMVRPMASGKAVRLRRGWRQVGQSRVATRGRR